MAEIDSAAVERIPALFYEAMVDDALWSTAMGEVKAAFNIALTGFGWFAETEDSSVMLYGDCEPYFERLFHELREENIFVPHMLGTRVGEMFHDSAIMSKAELRKTGMYNEWFVPQDLHSAVVARVPGPVRAPGFLIIQRGGRQPDFDETDMRLFGGLLPPLVHALRLRERMIELRLGQRGRYLNSVHVGFIVADAAGRIQHSNDAAERALGLGIGLTASAGRLSAAGTSLAGLLASAAARSVGGTSGGDLLVRDPATGQPRWALTVGPLRGIGASDLAPFTGAAVFVRDLVRQPSTALAERVADLFGLTQREALLAAALASGQTLEEAALARGISMATARSQLAAVFRKTETAQQSQLVALLLHAIPATL